MPNHGGQSIHEVTIALDTLHERVHLCSGTILTPATPANEHTYEHLSIVANFAMRASAPTVCVRSLLTILLTLFIIFLLAT